MLPDSARDQEIADIIGHTTTGVTQVENTQGLKRRPRLALRKFIDFWACANQIPVTVGVVDTSYGWPELA